MKEMVQIETDDDVFLDKKLDIENDSALGAGAAAALVVELQAVVVVEAVTLVFVAVQLAFVFAAVVEFHYSTHCSQILFDMR